MKAVYLMLLLQFNLHVHSQNVGIVSFPAAPLHIKSDLSEILRLQAVNPIITFFNGANYKGYIWHDGTKMELGTSKMSELLFLQISTALQLILLPMED